MAKHDENKDLKSIAKIGKIDIVSKVIRVNKNTNIGIRRWGKLDFLTKYRGWTLIYDNTVKEPSIVVSDSVSISKKDKKQHNLTDKRK